MCKVSQWSASARKVLAARDKLEAVKDQLVPSSSGQSRISPSRRLQGLCDSSQLSKGPTASLLANALTTVFSSLWPPRAWNVSLHFCSLTALVSLWLFPSGACAVLRSAVFTAAGDVHSWGQTLYRQTPTAWLGNTHCRTHAPSASSIQTRAFREPDVVLLFLCAREVRLSNSHARLQFSLLFGALHFQRTFWATVLAEQCDFSWWSPKEQSCAKYRVLLQWCLRSSRHENWAHHSSAPRKQLLSFPQLVRGNRPTLQGFGSQEVSLLVSQPKCCWVCVYGVQDEGIYFKE